jgi:hypothetical protein
MAASHRLYPEDDLGLPLAAGALRPASIGWHIDGQGFQRPYLKPEPSAEMIVAVDPPWYIDLAEGEAGPLEVTGNPDVVNRLFSLPPLSATEAAQVAEALSELAPDLPLPGSEASDRLRLVDAPLIPVLQLETLHTHGHRAWRNYPQNFGGGEFDVAKVIFRYGDADIRPEEKSEFITLPEGETIRLQRRPEAEAKALEALAGSGLQKIPGHTLHTFGSPPEGIFGLADESHWVPFMQEGAQRLKEAGWQVEFPEDFRHHVIEVDGWDAELVESDNGWFNLDMGILVEGERLPLAPLLANLFRSDPRWLEVAELERVPDDEGIDLYTARGKRLRVPAGRLKPLAATLIDLFDGFTGGDVLRLSRFDAPRLAELSDLSRWQFRGQSDIMALAERLLAAQGIADVEPPPAFASTCGPISAKAWPGCSSCAPTAVRHPGRRHGPRQDGPNPGPPAAGKGSRPPRQAGPGHPAHLADLQLEERSRPLRPDLKVLSLHGPERKPLRRNPRARRGAHHLPAAVARCRRADAAQLPPAHPRRSADGQERPEPERRSAQDRGAASPVPDRHAAGKPPGRAVEPVRLPAARLSRHQQAFTRHWRTPIEKQGDMARRRCSPAASPPSSCAARRKTWPPNCRPRPSSQRRTRRPPARPLRNRARHHGPSATRSPARASRAARSSSSTPCSSCARCAATRASSRPTPPPR